MSVVSGVIGIKDNMTSVLRSIRQEQSAFRTDVEKTKKELQATWDKKRTAKLDATTATKKANELKKRLEPLRKKVVTVVAIKDMAKEKIKSITNKVKAVGKMVAKPVVNVVVKGAQALSAVGKGIKQVAKVAAVGVGAVAAATGAILGTVFSGSLEAATAAIEAETQLAQVMKNTTGATAEQIQSVIDLAKAQERVGVVSADVQTSGMQELGTYISEVDSLKNLMPVMNDMLVQQYGLNASQENAVNIATMMGKVLNGQVGGLSKLGYSFTATQERILKYGTEAQKVATLADVISESVGGMNQAMAESPLGKIKQLENAYGSMKEEIGRIGITIKGQLADAVMKNLPVIERLGGTMMSVISDFADFAIPKVESVISKVAPVIESGLSKVSDVAKTLKPVLSNVFGGLSTGAKVIKPILKEIVSGFKPIFPQLLQFGSSVSGAVQKVATSVLPVISTIIRTVQAVIPVVLPVLETVITTISSLISRAAPIISGMVEGIGTVIQTLAPVFQTIFDGIGAKVGTIIDFVSSKMGFIQDVIGTVAPIIADVLTTVWGVISPVMDALINIFKVIFNVVQRVWPGIQKILETVWGIIKPIVEGVGMVVGKIAGAFGWIADKLSGGGGQEVGSNAQGTNNWRGGLTWVGEHGPELVNLPGGSQVLPNKESVQITQAAMRRTAPVSAAAGGEELRAIIPLLTSIGRGVDAISAWLMQARQGGKAQGIAVNIAKLADQIIVREEADIDKIGDGVTKKVILALQNT